MSRTYSILHCLAYPLWTGPAEPVVRLARAQLDAGHDVALAVDRLRDGDLVAKAAEWGVPLFDGLSLSVKAGPIINMRDILAFKRLFVSGRFEFIHCHRSHDHTLAALARPKHSRTRLLRTLHTEEAASPSRRWQLRRADGLICTFKAMRDDLCDRGLMAPDRIVAIEGAVDSELFRPGLHGPLREELGLDEETVLVGMVARMKEGRGHRSLLNAWRQVEAKLPGVHLLLAGRGELEESLRHEVEDQSWALRLHFVGYRNDLPAFYPDLQLKVILAPGNDGTCRAALEAMACGVPVLAAPQGALAEIVEDGSTGKLVPEGDLSQALWDLLRQPEDLLEMGRRARQAAVHRFTLSRQLERIQGLMAKLSDS